MDSDSSLLISALKPRPMASRACSMLLSGRSSKNSGGNCSAHLDSTAQANSVSLSVKWLYTVSLETPASAAMASILLPS